MDSDSDSDSGFFTPPHSPVKLKYANQHPPPLIRRSRPPREENDLPQGNVVCDLMAQFEATTLSSPLLSPSPSPSPLPPLARTSSEKTLSTLDDDSRYMIRRHSSSLPGSITVGSPLQGGVDATLLRAMLEVRSSLPTTCSIATRHGASFEGQGTDRTVCGRYRCLYTAAHARRNGRGVPVRVHRPEQPEAPTAEGHEGEVRRRLPSSWRVAHSPGIWIHLVGGQTAPTYPSCHRSQDAVDCRSERAPPPQTTNSDCKSQAACDSVNCTCKRRAGERSTVKVAHTVALTPALSLPHTRPAVAATAAGCWHVQCAHGAGRWQQRGRAVQGESMRAALHTHAQSRELAHGMHSDAQLASAAAHVVHVERSVCRCPVMTSTSPVGPAIASTVSVPGATSVRPASAMT